MNCPNCRKELPESHAAAACPFCGGALAPAGSPATAERGWTHRRALIYFLLLLIPPVLTIISARLMQTPNESISPGIALLGGGAAGITAGILFGLQTGRTAAARFWLCVIFALLMPIVSITLCFVGCNLGGYHMRFN